MADIDIQRKEGNPVPWIFGVLALILIIGGIIWFTADDDAELAVTDPVEETVIPGTAPGVTQPTEPTSGAEFAAWVRDSAEALDAMGREHEYTREGIQRMASALENLVARDTAPAVQQRIETLRQQARAIRESAPESVDHAGQARQAFTTAVEILDDLRQRPQLRQANLDEAVNEARAAAEQVTADRPLLEQRAEVHRFFDRMSDAIERAEGHNAAR